MELAVRPRRERESQGVSSYTLSAELSAISNNANLGCYISSLDPPATPLARKRLREVERCRHLGQSSRRGLAINQYVTSTLKYRPNAAELAAAKTSLEDEMTKSGEQHDQVHRELSRGGRGDARGDAHF